MPGCLGTPAHDYKRNSTKLFGALYILEGKVIGKCRQKHRHQEFISFLNAIERKIPAGKVIHVILDNYATHKHHKIRAWLASHPRWTFHVAAGVALCEGFSDADPPRTAEFFRTSASEKRQGRKSRF